MGERHSARREARAPDREAEPDRRGGPGHDVLALQQLVGNRAVAAMVQRLETKPKTPGGLDSTLSMLEKAIRNDDYAAAKTAASFLHASSAVYYADLLRYKLTKHEEGSDKRQSYLDASPEDAKATAVRVAVEKGDETVVAVLLPYFFSLTPSQRMALARRSNATFMVEKVLTPGKEQGMQMVEVLQEQDFVGYLSQRAPAAYATFAGATPQLKVVEDVKGALPGGATSRQVVDAIFQAIITNTSIELAYLATQLTPVDQVLLGDTKASRSLRAQQAKVLPDIPDIPATDCHHLLSAFENILKSYPGLDVDYDRVTLTKAVMTQPLSGVPGGLIAKTFPGNVFDDAGAATGRIFFTGEDGVNSHSWLKVDGRAYDILFGTTGSAVRGGVGGEFVKTKDPKVFRQSGGSSYLIVDDTLTVSANPYSFKTAYRLTTDPTRYGKVLAAL